MFMGTSNNSIDEKNSRLVPSGLRCGRGSRCMVTKGRDCCLYIYTTEAWDRQMEKISKLPESDPKVRAFIRHFCANAAECEFDKQGRIVIPQELKNYAKIEKKLVTMGAMSKIEVWSKEVWDAPDNESKMNTEDFANALAEYNF